MAKEVVWRLSYSDGNGVEHAVRVASGAVLTAGRAQNSDIIVDEASVSRRHFRVSARDDGLSVEDLESGNGLLIDENRINTGLWQPGHVLKAGKVSFSLQAWAASDSPPQRSPMLQTRTPAIAAATQYELIQSTARLSTMSNDQLRVFVSYSRRDAAIVDRIAKELESRDFTVVIDRRDLPFGEEWRRELGDLIRTSDVVLFFISDNSVSSKVCRWELGQISALGKRIFPIAIGPYSVANLPAELGKVQILPPSGVFSLDKHVVSLVRALSTDRAWVKERSRLFDRACEWIARGEIAALLLRGPAIRAADEWLSRKPKTEQIPYEIAQLIRTSRKASVNRRLAWAGGGVLLAAAGLVVAFVISQMYSDNAQLRADLKAKEQAAADIKAPRTETEQERDRRLAEFRRVQQERDAAARAETARRQSATPKRSMLLVANRAIDGVDLKMLSPVDIDTCSRACQDETRCQAYAYDKWNRSCFIKQSFSLVRRDAQYDSGLASDAGSTPPQSPAPLEIERYRNKSIPDGTFTTVPAADYDACARRCDDSCTAVTFVKSKKQCRIFTDAGEYFGDNDADSGIKRQRP